jgi:hypothetical protein
MPVKSGLESARKTLKSPILSAGKLVDGSLNPLGERVANVIKPFVDAYQAVDQEKKIKEEKRQAEIQASFDKMTNVVLTAAGSSSAVIEAMIDDLADFDFNPDVFQERTEEAVKKHFEISEKLSEMLVSQIQFEERKKEEEEHTQRLAEIEAREKAIKEKEEAEERKAESERRRIEEQRIAKEYAEKARAEAEAKHKIEMEQAEMRRVKEQKEYKERAIRQAEAAAEAERKKIEEEKIREEQEAAEREANRKYKLSIHNQILDAMKSVGIKEENGKAFIKLVVACKAGNIRINY